MQAIIIAEGSMVVEPRLLQGPARLMALVRFCNSRPKVNIRSFTVQIVFGLILAGGKSVLCPVRLYCSTKYCSMVKRDVKHSS